jgi:CRP/FNR family cyclic AMP-dependent transcriptional regulator
MDIIDQLEGSRLFRGVARADREALIARMSRQSYPKGAVLFEKGDAGDSMYIILSGRVRIYTRDAQNNEITIRYLSEMFGEFAVLDQKPRSASAAAADDLEVLVLHRNDFYAFLRERPLVGLSMMRSLVERVRYTTTYLQRVLDATEQLSQGDYQAMQTVTESGGDEEIQVLIGAFVQMVRGVRAREESLRRERDPNG